jgi:two-component system response regulator HydG
MDYEWPGNVHELENALERACMLSTGPIVHLGDLPTQLQNFRLANRRPVAPVPEIGAEQVVEEEPVLPLAALEKQAILDTLKRLNGDKLLAARLLGIGKTTLYRKLKEYGISDSGHEEPGSEGNLA